MKMCRTKSSLALTKRGKLIFIKITCEADDEKFENNACEVSMLSETKLVCQMKKMRGLSHQWAHPYIVRSSAVPKSAS